MSRGDKNRIRTFRVGLERDANQEACSYRSIFIDGTLRASGIKKDHRFLNCFDVDVDCGLSGQPESRRSNAQAADRRSAAPCPHFFPSTVAQTSQPRAAHPAKIMERHVLQIAAASLTPNARSLGPRGRTVRGSFFVGLAFVASPHHHNRIVVGSAFGVCLRHSIQISSGYPSPTC